MIPEAKCQRILIIQMWVSTLWSGQRQKKSCRTRETRSTSHSSRSFTRRVDLLAMLSKTCLMILVKEMKYKDLLCPKLNLKEQKLNRQRRICLKISQGLQKTALLIRMIPMETIDQDSRWKTQKLQEEQVRSLNYKEWPLWIMVRLF